MKNDRVYILRESVVKITQMLSGKGIRVTQQGVTAYVKADHNGVPIVVNLPYLPDNATEELCAAIQGFLDHEVAHILFTDFTLMGKVIKTHDKTAGFFLNALEDPRIEKEMAKRFQGSAHNLSVTGKFFLDKFIEPALKEKAGAGDAEGVINTLLVPMIRAMSGQHIFKSFMSDKWKTVAPIYERIKDLEGKIEAATSTKDCYDLTVEIVKRLSEDSEPGEPGEGSGKKTEKKSAATGKGKPGKSKEKSEDEEGEGESTKGKPGKKSEKEEKGSSSKPKKEEKPKEEEKEKEGSGKPEKEEKPKEGEGKSEPEEKDEEEAAGEEEGKEESEDEGKEEELVGEEDKGEGEDDPEDEGEDDDELTGMEMPEKSEGGREESKLGKSSAIISKLDKEGANAFDEGLSKVISAASVSAAANASYHIFSKDFDVIEKLVPGRGYNPAMTQKLIDAVDHMVAPLQKDLERAVAARSLATRSHGHRSGRLHAANLSRLAFDDPRVFSRKQESQSKDVAVELVIDMSGSMSGAKIHTATQAAYALSAVLERINIRNEVIAFTTKDPGAALSSIQAEQSKLGRSFSRVEGIYMPILKTFDERLNAQVKERFGWLPNCSMLRNNIDGESVENAARRLMARREEGKILIVLSDGYPACSGNSADQNKKLKDVVQDVSRAGVKVIGIGIMSDAVRQFYPKNIVLNNVSELPTTVIKELRHLLLG